MFEFEDCCERPTEPRVDRVDRGTAATHFFADALVDKHVGINGDTDGEHDTGYAGNVSVAFSSDNTPKIIATLIATAMFANNPNRP